MNSPSETNLADSAVDSLAVPATKKATKKRVSGVILIDKPQGMTSQQVVSKVKYLFKSPQHDCKKAGHTGTLDPMATGLLPICLGEATKFSHYQLDANKSYLAIIKLGERTDTGDAEGQVIETASVPELSEEDCQRVAELFLGPQTQIPPMYSALKKEGKKLYEYARAGIEVDRPARPMVIYALTIQRLSANSLQIEVTCSKGTYVRVLGEDIAQALGSIGYLTSLRRTKVGDFNITNAIGLAELEDLSLVQRFDWLLGADTCVNHLPTLTLSDEQWQRVRLGQRLNVYPQLSTDIHQYLSESTTVDHNKHSINDAEVTGMIKGDAEAKDNHETSGTLSKDICLTNAQGDFIGLATLDSSGRLQPKKIINL